MQKKEYTFIIKDECLKIFIKDGAISHMQSSIRAQSDNKFEEMLSLAIQADFDEFIRLYECLHLDTAHYKMAKRILKSKKEILELQLQKIKRVMPE